MASRAYSKGWPVVYDGEKWVWEDSGISLNDEERPCRRCGRWPTPEGYDACMGFIEEVTNACCGHGAEKPFKQ